MDSITTLAETDSEDGLIHESFYPDGYWRFTRQEFGWANALYAELLFRTLAGYPALEHVRGERGDAAVRAAYANAGAGLADRST